MTNQQKFSGTLHFALWTAQVLLAASMAWGGVMKLFYPAAQLSGMWPWTSAVSPALLNFTGIVDLLGAAGLILPALTRIQPKLTPFTACAVIMLMGCASIFHIMRNEASVIGANVFFALTAVFIAWGRFVKVPVLPK
ncbi:DoxX family protein [Dyadobacter sediminis]|uniref:DoxX family protein n=2 Tax=Dyadobacter sediminis TaxID=1493691 RepID=A0A5R9KCR0_9BACT|nr:DoxX family protein [Dyadobacter sediminis]